MGQTLINISNEIELNTEFSGSSIDFIFLINSEIDGITENDEILLPFKGENIIINWGDGTEEAITQNSTPDNNIGGNNITHSYLIPGVYLIKISSGLTQINFNNGGDKDKLIDICNWGSMQLETLENAFFGCSNLLGSAKDSLDTTLISNYSQSFRNCTSLKTLDVSNWNLSSTTSLLRMFSYCTSLETLDVSNWDVSNVSNFIDSFFLCNNLESLDVSNWDTSSATRMDSCFRGCSKLTFLDVSNWNISNVTVLQFMFQDCTSLKTLDVSNWDVSSVTNMFYTFTNCLVVEELDVSNWNVNNVSNFRGTFVNCDNLTTLGCGNWQLRQSGTFLREIFSRSYSSSVSLEPITGTGINSISYTEIIVSWANYVYNNSPQAPINVDMTTQARRTFDTSLSGGDNFNNAGDARDFLINVANWNITSDIVI